MRYRPFMVHMLVTGVIAALYVLVPAYAWPSDAGQGVYFDIPAQPLASALERYGDLTGREVLYDAGLAQGRTSGAVHGFLSPEAALYLLLDGTGLSARFMEDRSFVLMAIPPVEENQSRQANAPAVRDRYYARIQLSLRDALCSDSETRPGRYRVTALFWIGSSGQVERYERLSSAGSPALNRKIDGALRYLDVGAPPPPDFAQPVLITVLPQAPGITMGCETGSDGKRSAGSAP